MLLEELEDVADVKVVADYEPKGLDPNEEPESQEKKEDSKAKYMSMELP